MYFQLITLEIAAAMIGEALPSAVSKVPVVGLAMIPVNVYASYWEQVRLENSINTLATAYHASAIASDLDLHASIIISESNPPQVHVKFYPSINTAAQIAALNRLIQMQGLPGGVVTWEDIERRPEWVSDMIFRSNFALR